MKKRNDLLKYEFYSPGFLKYHKLVLLLQLYPEAENNLKCSFIIHLTLLRDRMERYEF